MSTDFAELQPSAERLGAVSGFVNEFINAIEPRHLFEEFSREEMALFSEYLQCFGVPRQSVVIRHGDVGDFLAVLMTGSAVILKGPEGQQQVAGTVQPGEMIGEISFVEGIKRDGNCVTTEPSDIGVLTTDSLNALLAEHPRLGNKFLLMLLRHSASKFRNANGQTSPGLSAFI